MGINSQTCASAPSIAALSQDIRLHELQVVPINSDLSFDNFRAIRKSLLIWRDGDFVGATYESRAFLNLNGRWFLKPEFRTRTRCCVPAWRDHEGLPAFLEEHGSDRTRRL
jgi:hypothetical protein